MTRFGEPDGLGQTHLFRWRGLARTVPLMGLAVTLGGLPSLARETGAIPVSLRAMASSLPIASKGGAASRPGPTGTTRATSRPARVTLRARVVDDQGNPVQGARITVAGRKARWGLLARILRRPTKTDPEGRFTLRSMKAGQLKLIISTTGFRRVERRLDLRPGMAPVDIRLEGGHPIRVRFVNAQGEPVPDVHVLVTTDEPASAADSLRTDAQGRLVWHAPTEAAATFLAFSAQYKQSEKTLTPGPTEHVVVLQSPLHICGTVKDAETGSPIKDFRIRLTGDGMTPTLVHALGGDAWNSDPAKPGQIGIGLGVLPSMLEDEPAQFVIEADGYALHTTEPIKLNRETVTLEVKLRREAWITGVVCTPDGEPAGEAIVAQASAKSWVHIKNRKLDRSLTHGELRHAIAKADGTFTVPKLPEAFGLVVLHEAGCLIVSGEKLGNRTPCKLVLVPWARVEGQVRIGGKPAADREVEVTTDGPREDALPHVMHECTARTDDQGGFVFQRVLPGEGRIGYRPGPPVHHIPLSHLSEIALPAGKTKRVTLGGRGRPVIGRIVLPDDVDARRLVWNTLHNQVNPALRPNSSEQLMLGMDPEQVPRGILVAIERDGRFRAEDVPAGRYVLKVNVHRRRSRRPLLMGEEVGTVRHRLRVDRIPGGRSDEPLDLGDIPLHVRKKLVPGQQAPVLSGKTLGGKPTRLADYRGKVVLLHFWKMPRDQETARFIAIHRRFASHPKFQMLGGAFHSRRMAKRLAGRAGMTWPQIAIDDEEEKAVQIAYGLPLSITIEAMPPILIGPDGKVIEVIDKGSRLLPVIRKAVGNP